MSCWDVCNCSDEVPKCGPAPPPPKSCFIRDAQVMIDISKNTRNIQDIKIGDYVLSGKTFKPTRVLYVDEEKLGNRRLVGINHIDPFMTEDHCLIDPFSPTRRAVNNNLNLQHWSHLEKLRINDSIYYDCKIQNCHKITKRSDNENLPVFDLITEDHSYIVNGISVYDEFPEIDKNPFVSIIIYNILAMLDDVEKNKSRRAFKLEFDSIYNKYIEKAKHQLFQDLDNDRDIDVLLKKNLLDFLKLFEQKSHLVHLASDLWAYKFDSINTCLSENMLQKNIPKNNYNLHQCVS